MKISGSISHYCAQAMVSARCASNQQIAFELGLTERTVKMHRAAMLNRLGAKTIADAMRIAIEAGL